MVKRVIDLRQLAYPVCKNLGYNLDTLHDAPWDEHIDTRRPQNNSRTLRTTSTQAFSADYTRAETRMHRLSYTDLSTSACRPSKVYPFRVDGLESVLVAENSGQKVWYDAEDNAEAQEDSLLVLMLAYRSVRLKQKWIHGQQDTN